jgi:hypothetical protein
MGKYKINMKPVNLNTQILLFFIPVVGYYAWYRIGKLWSGFFLNLAMMLYQNYLFLVVAIIGFAIKIYFLIKWSKEHNIRCDNDKM